jgi:predicted transport protein
MSLEEYFSTGEPLERAVYDAVRAQLDGLQPLTVEFVSVGIFFKRARTFAELRPKRDRKRRLRIELSFLVSRALEHPRFARSWRGAGQRSAYFVDFYDAREVDDEVRDWLVEAYLASPD